MAFSLLDEQLEFTITGNFTSISVLFSFEFALIRSTSPSTYEAFKIWNSIGVALDFTVLACRKQHITDDYLLLYWVCDVMLVLTYWTQIIPVKGPNNAKQGLHIPIPGGVNKFSFNLSLNYTLKQYMNTEIIPVM